jgi:undecaprenyl diphosphate synthase
MQKTNIQCLGFIMDGNRRWAKELGLPTFEGHQKGAEVMRDSVRWVKEAGIPHVVYYAFSTENWKRSKEEVSWLMKLFSEMLEKQFKEKNIRIRIVGRRKDFDTDLQKQMNELEKYSEKNENIETTVWIALSYGGRAEIIEATNRAIRNGKEVTEETFAQLLWTADMPDPDIIVRTGGEKRLSNFMTWRSVYSELLFIDTYWPALTKVEFNGILKEYESRERRGGK